MNLGRKSTVFWGLIKCSSLSHGWIINAVCTKSWLFFRYCFINNNYLFTLGIYLIAQHLCVLLSFCILFPWTCHFPSERSIFCCPLLWMCSAGCYCKDQLPFTQDSLRTYRFRFLLPETFPNFREALHIFILLGSARPWLFLSLVCCCGSYSSPKQ